MIEINWTLGVQAVNFFVMLVFLNHFIFKPILAHVEKRERELKDIRGEAEEMRKKGEEALSAYEAGMANIRNEAAQRVAEARQQAAERMSEKMTKARKEFDAKIETARAQIQNDINAASTALKTEINGFARVMAGKILGRSL